MSVTTTINSGFIGCFKLGDNIVHNLSILRELYDCQRESETAKELLRKPIIVMIGSIAEAVLFDFFLRINQFTNEGVPDIPEDILDDIRTKTIDEFSKYIDVAKSKSLFDANANIYDSLHELRKLRNRIHIQNTKKYFEPDEVSAFSEDRQLHAESTLKELLQRMEMKYGRSSDKHYVADFVLTW